MSGNVPFGNERSAKIQISLRICAVLSESSFDAISICIAKDAKFLHADKDDSDEIVRADLSLH